MVCVVEFAGRPGAGKTTLCEALCHEVSACHEDDKIQVFMAGQHRVSRIARKLFILASYWSCHRQRFQEVKRAVRQTVPIGEMKRFMITLVNALQIDHCLSRAIRSTAGFVFLDQGFSQLCWYNISRNDIANISEPLEHLYRPFKEHCLNVVFVETDVPTQRYNLSCRKDLPNLDASVVEGLNTQSFDQVVKTMRDLPSINFVRVKNDVIGNIDLEGIVRCLNLHTRPTVNSHGKVDSSTTYCIDRDHVI